MTPDASDLSPKPLRHRLARHAAAAAIIVTMVALPGLAWAQTRLPPWQLGLCLSLATVLAASLVAVLLVQRQSARHADQLAAICGLIASLDRNARAAEARGAELLSKTAERLETALGDTETTFREDGETFKATVRYLETQGATVASLVGKLETLMGAAPQPAEPGAAGEPAARAAAPDAATLARLDALLEAQAERDAATSALLDSVRAVTAQLPALTEASAERLDAALADAVTRRLALFETVGAAMARLIERADAAPGFARLETVATRLDAAAAAMTPLNDALLRLETTAGLPPLITRLIEQAQQAQDDLKERFADTPGLARLETVATRLDDAAAAMAPLDEALRRLEATAGLPALLARLILQAQQAQADLTQSLSNAPGLARLETLSSRLDEAAAAMAPLDDALRRLESTAELPAQIARLIDQARQAQANLTEGLADAPGLARLETVAARLDEAAAAMLPLNDALRRLETTADLPPLIRQLIEQAQQAQADLSEGLANAPGLARLDNVSSRLDEAAAAMAPLNDALRRLEASAELPPLIADLVAQARQLQVGLSESLGNPPGLERLETAASQLAETAAAMAPLGDVLHRLEATAGLPPLITRLIEQAQQAQADVSEKLAATQPASSVGPHPDTLARLEALSSLPALMARLTEEAGQASSAFTETAAAAMAEIAAAASALAPLAETASHLDGLKTLPAQLNALTENAAAAQADFVYVAEAAAAKMAETASTLSPLADTATRLENLTSLPADLAGIAEAADAAKSILAAASEAAASVAGTAASFRPFAETAAQLETLKSLPAELHRLAQTAAIAQAGVANTADEAAARIAEATENFGPIADAVQRLETLSPLSAQLAALADNAAAAQAGLTDAASETASRIEAAASLLDPLSDILGRFEALAGMPEELARLAGSAAAAQSALTNTAGAAADRIAEALHELAAYADMGVQLGELATLAEKLSQLANQTTAATACLAETSAYLGTGANATIEALQAQTDALGMTAYRLAETEPALARLSAALADMPDQLGVTLAERIQAQLGAHQDTARQILAGLHEAFAAIPEKVNATLTEFSEAEAERQDRLSAAWTRQHSETATAIESLAARADAALAALPAEADLIASMLENANRAGARLAEAISRLENTSLPDQGPALPADLLTRLESAIGRLESRSGTADKLEPLVAELRASIASLAQPSSPPAWLPRLAELDTALRDTLAALRDRDEAAGTMERAAAALTAAANETMGHGYAQLQRLDTILSRTAQPPAELSALPTLVENLQAALATQQNAAQDIQRAAAEAASAAARALALGEAQQSSADRLLAAAESVRQAAAPREGLAVIPGLVATCRALATDLGTLARGAPAPTDLAARAPVLLAALQQGADDLRTAATSLALARDSLPDAA
jgi:DNA repair exonuclease SbcCD ATPase subunit